MATLKRMAIGPIVTLIGVACAAFMLVPTFVVEATAQQGAAVEGFVTGSGSTDGFSLIGRVRLFSEGKASGKFPIIVHRDVVDGTTVAAFCDYTRFDSLIIDGNNARFHSVGKCKALTRTGGQQSFSSDNAFSIRDNGEPGVGTDTVDVNLVSGTGLAVPGSFLVDGNFLVSP